MPKFPRGEEWLATLQQQKQPGFIDPSNSFIIFLLLKEKST